MSGIAGHVIVGTPPYLSPEALAHHRAHPSFDLWALCVVFYEVLTGRRPFEGTPEEELAAAITEHRATPISDRLSDCPPALTRFFGTAFAPEATARPRSAAQLASRLSSLRNP